MIISIGTRKQLILKRGGINMEKFTSDMANVSYSVAELKVKNNLVEGAKTITCKSKSELFRTMYDFGMEVCEIAKTCDSHYSFVYGVVSSNREMRKVVKESSSDEIRRLAATGLKPGEIAKQLNKNYSFVFSVVKKWKATQEEAIPEAKEA